MTPDERRADLIRRTLELVRIASPSGHEGEAAAYVERTLAAETAPARLTRTGNAVLACYGDPEPGIVLAGHLDTVPANDNFPPGVEDGNVRGLGTTDMKGGLAVMSSLAAARFPREGEALPGAPFALVYYDCEEVGYDRNGLRPLLERERWLHRAQLALLLEPTANALELGCLGTLHARVVFSGVAAHSARPWTGENAIHAAAPFLQRVAAIKPRVVVDGPAEFQEVVSVTLAEGGKTRNVIPDTFTLNVNLRFAPDRSPAQAEAYVRELVADEAGVEIVDAAPAAPARAEAPALARFLEVSRVTPRAKQAWTDVAQFAQAGVPAANFGPGIPELAHKRDELVPAQNLFTCFTTLSGYLDSGTPAGD